MHAKSILTSVSAAALMASVGIAYAAPQQTSQQTPQQNQQSWNQQQSSTTSMQTQPQQVASEAAMVLRHNAQGNMQSGQMQSGSMSQSQQIPQQVIAAARCVAVFPSNAAMTTGGTTGATYPGNSTGATTTRSSSMNSDNANTSSSGMANTHMASNSERVGVASCRNDNGQWTSSSPVFVRISKLHLMNTSMEMQGNGAMSGQTRMNSGAETGQTGTNSSYAQPGTNNAYASTGTQTGTHTAETGQSGMNAYGTAGASSETGNALVLVFVNDDAANTLQSGDFTLGDDVDVTAGPTDLQSGGTVSAPVLAYTSNSQGGFTGATVKGAQVQFDKQANQQIYGNDADPEDLLQGEGNNEQAQGHLTAFNQALSQFAPSSQYNSNTSIVK
ncbi:MAG TPA: YSC84-related protein [Gammaproteobacteria bacterium]|nr:YSC84-related protein [Gammaproteobacteria bacterium]HET7370845.1 YSC84-related protein [Gammaproteobacteria bacterium]